MQAVGNAEGWLDSLGELGEALRAWRAALIGDLGGEERISTQQRAIIEVATRTYLESIDRWLLAQPSLVNKSRRQLFPVVTQREALAAGLLRSMAALGLERRDKPALELTSYLSQRYSPTTNRTTKEITDGERDPADRRAGDQGASGPPSTDRA
jgi:hypothetical protein